MKTDLSLSERTSLKTSPWGSLIGLILLGNLLGSLLRLYGASGDRALLVIYGVAGWKINWLFISPVILFITNLLGWLFLWKRWRGFLLVAWVTFAVNLLSYWAERLLVWSSDQNLQGNLGFMTVLFVIYLALMLLFTLDLKPKDRN